MSPSAPRTWPVAHAVQSLLPATDAVPSGQGVHAPAPLTAKVLAAHGAHTALPVVLAKRPPSQAVHEGAPSPAWK